MFLLLDTDVLSALMRSDTPPAVMAWIARQNRENIFISAITRAEIEDGIFRAPEGGKKIALRAAADKIFREYEKRCLPFNADSAKFYAIARSAGKTTRQPTSVADMMIAAIALQNKLTLATRNTRHFASIAALETVNPWT